MLQQVTEDNSTNIEYIRALVGKENLDLLFDIFECLLHEGTLTKLWNLQAEVMKLVGISRMSVSDLFKVLYKLCMTSGMAISQ